METIHQWFRREIYRWRTGASIVWSLVCLPTLITLYVFLVTFSFLHPISSLCDFFAHIFSWHFYMYLTCLMAVYLATVLYNCQHFSVLPDIPATRLEWITSHLRGSKLSHAFITSFGGATIAWCLSGFIGGYYGRMYATCTTQGGGICLNEQHLVFVLHALFTGLLHHYTFYSQQKNYLQFMAVHQPKLLQAKNSVVAIIINSFMNTLSATKYFYLWYYICGDIPKYWVMSNLKLHTRSLPPINSLYGMLDIPLFLHLLLCGTFLRLAWNISHLLYKLHNTEPYTLPIDGPLCLSNGLVCDSAPLVQHLTFLDLHRLSSHDPTRRKHIFTLSQPGGHPRNWNGVNAACLAQVDMFGEAIQRANWTSLADQSVNGDVSASNLNGHGEKLTAPIRATTPDPIRFTFHKLYLNVKTKPLICYLLNTLPDCEPRRMFAGCQPVLWAVDGLANLACASYTEDPYGIVQRSLPTILISLLNLHENIEKYFKLTPSASRRQRDQLGSHDASLRHNLRHVTKTAIYRIVHLFGKHLQELCLSDEHLRKLRLFQQYKE